MKRQKKYTFILTSNTADSVKRISFSAKSLKRGAYLFLGFLGALVLFFTDYFGMVSYQVEVHVKK